MVNAIVRAASAKPTTDTDCERQHRVHGEMTASHLETGATSSSLKGASKSGTPFLRVKNWEQFQHYGKRNPPWIKLHRALLDDYAFCALPDDAKAHLMMLWLYASQHNGKIPADVAFLERKLSCNNINLHLLVEHGFLIWTNDASEVPA
jgi:hypothetical protein